MPSSINHQISPSALVVSNEVQIEGKDWSRLGKHRPRVTTGQQQLSQSKTLTTATLSKELLYSLLPGGKSLTYVLGWTSPKWTLVHPIYSAQSFTYNKMYEFKGYILVSFNKSVHPSTSNFIMTVQL